MQELVLKLGADLLGMPKTTELLNFTDMAGLPIILGLISSLLVFK